MAFPAAMNMQFVQGQEAYYELPQTYFNIYKHHRSRTKKQKRENNKFAYELGVQEIFLA
jgi:hypothetical protein